MRGSSVSGEGGGGIGSDAALGRAPPPPAPPADAPAALPLGLFCAGWPREGARWPLGYLSGRGLQQGVPLRKRRGIDCRRRESGGCLARGVGRGGGRCGGHIEGGGRSRAAVKGRWDAECTSGRRVREVWHVAKATAGGGEESGVDQPGQ